MEERKSNIIFFVVIGVLVTVIALNIYLFTAVLFKVSVDGHSMDSTLSHGDVLIVNRKADVDRGDVVIIKRQKELSQKVFPDENGRVDLSKLTSPCIKVLQVRNEYEKLQYKVEGNFLIIENPRHDVQVDYLAEYSVVKRAIGLEGDTVKIENGKVYLKKADESSFQVLQEDYLDEHIQTHPIVDYPKEWTVGANEVFYLGDNRVNSEDSRVDGCCKLTDVEGVVSKFAIWIKPVTTWFANLFS